VTTALATQPTHALANGAAFVKQNKQHILDVARTSAQAEAVLKSALIAIDGNADLQKCSAKSLLACVMGAARLGLEVSSAVAGRGYVYFIPRGANCTLQIGYRGMIEMASRSSRFRSIRAEVIRKNDEFAYRPADDQPIVHTPAWKESNKQDNIIGAWAMATLASGEKVAIVLNADDLKNIAKSSQETGNYYKNHFAEWCRARAIKRLCKILPLDGDSQPVYATPDEADDTLAVIDADVVETQPAKSRPLPPKVAKDIDDADAPKASADDVAAFTAAMEDKR
jgi:recombination protein RecT